MSEKLYVSEDPEGFLKCDLYDCSPDREELIHSDPDEAIQAALDQIEGPLSAAGETITVYGWTRRKLDPVEYGLDPENILSDILQGLDEEYGGDDATEPTAAMKVAAESLTEVIRREYDVWQCEQTHKAVVNVAAWVRENAPEWLERRA